MIYINYNEIKNIQSETKLRTYANEFDNNKNTMELISKSTYRVAGGCG